MKNCSIIEFELRRTKEETDGNIKNLAQLTLDKFNY